MGWTVSALWVGPFPLYGSDRFRFMGRTVSALWVGPFPLYGLDRFRSPRTSFKGWAVPFWPRTEKSRAPSTRRAGPI